jgi:hypothetical protein
MGLSLAASMSLRKRVPLTGSRVPTSIVATVMKSIITNEEVIAVDQVCALLLATLHNERTGCAAL